MSLTRKMLKAMGIEDEKIEQIIEAHTDTVNALKDERDEYKANAEKLAETEKELAKIKKDGKYSNEEYEKLKKSFDEYKADIAAKEIPFFSSSAISVFISSPYTASAVSFIRSAFPHSLPKTSQSTKPSESRISTPALAKLCAPETA